MAKRIVNPNFLHLRKSLQQGKHGSVLEGSSRSGKTWSSVDFIIYICSRLEEKCVINILRETYNSFKTTLYDDFNRRLPMFGIPSPFENVKEVPSFKLFGSKVNLIGADKVGKSKGVGCDYLYGNEMMEIPQQVWDQYEMRCRKFWWMDYNPSATKHYIFDSVIPRDNVSFLKTTFLDNPFISEKEKRKILSYENTEENRRQGTVDEYMYKVFGLGERAARKGAVFPSWKITREWPEVDPLGYWLDFGYVNDPTAFGELIKHNGQLWVKEYFYETGLTNLPSVMNPNQKNILDKLKEFGVPKDALIFADRAEPKSIIELRNEGYNVYPAPKFPGSIDKGIEILTRWPVNIWHESSNIIDEQVNYRYIENKKEGPEFDNKPLDAYNHHIDGIRGIALYYNTVGTL